MIVKMLFGSHLYGTQTPSSDTDYKGVAMPSVRDIALGRVPGHVLHQSTSSGTWRASLFQGGSVWPVIM